MPDFSIGVTDAQAERVKEAVAFAQRESDDLDDAILQNVREAAADALDSGELELSRGELEELSEALADYSIDALDGATPSSFDDVATRVFRYVEHGQEYDPERDSALSVTEEDDHDHRAEEYADALRSDADDEEHLTLMVENPDPQSFDDPEAARRAYDLLADDLGVEYRDGPLSGEDGGDPPTTTIEFGDWDKAKEVREEYEKHLADDDDRRYKEVVIHTGGLTPAEMDAIKADAAEGRAVDEQRSTSVELTDGERERIKELDGFDRTTTTKSWESAKGVFAREGVQERFHDAMGALTDGDDPAEQAEQWVRKLKSEGSDRSGGARDVGEEDEQQKRKEQQAAARVQEEGCNHAREECKNGKPEACEHLKNVCGMDEEAVDALLSDGRDAVEEQTEQQDLVTVGGDQFPEMEVTPQEAGALRNSWTGYKSAVSDLADALDTLREETTNARRALSGINAIREAHDQGEMHGDRLHDLMDALGEMPESMPEIRTLAHYGAFSEGGDAPGAVDRLGDPGADVWKYTGDGYLASGADGQRINIEDTGRPGSYHVQVAGESGHSVTVATNLKRPDAEEFANLIASRTKPAVIDRGGDPLTAAVRGAAASAGPTIKDALVDRFAPRSTPLQGDVTDVDTDAGSGGPRFDFDQSDMATMPDVDEAIEEMDVGGDRRDPPLDHNAAPVRRREGEVPEEINGWSYNGTETVTFEDPDRGGEITVEAWLWYCPTNDRAVGLAGPVERYAAEGYPYVVLDRYRDMDDKIRWKLRYIAEDWPNALMEVHNQIERRENIGADDDDTRDPPLDGDVSDVATGRFKQPATAEIDLDPVQRDVKDSLVRAHKQEKRKWAVHAVEYGLNSLTPGELREAIVTANWILGEGNRYDHEALLKQAQQAASSGPPLDVDTTAVDARQHRRAKEMRDRHHKREIDAKTALDEYDAEDRRRLERGIAPKDEHDDAAGTHPGRDHRPEDRDRPERVEEFREMVGQDGRRLKPDPRVDGEALLYVDGEPLRRDSDDGKDAELPTEIGKYALQTRSPLQPPGGTYAGNGEVVKVSRVPTKDGWRATVLPDIGAEEKTNLAMTTTRPEAIQAATEYMAEVSQMVRAPEYGGGSDDSTEFENQSREFRAQQNNGYIAQSEADNVQNEQEGLGQFGARRSDTAGLDEFEGGSGNPNRPVAVVMTAIGGSGVTDAIEQSDALLGYEASRTEPPAGTVEFVDFPFTADETTQRRVEMLQEAVELHEPKIAVAPDIEGAVDVGTAAEIGDDLIRLGADHVVMVPKDVPPTEVPDRFRVGFPAADFGSDAGHFITDYADFDGDGIHVLGASPTVQLELASYGLDVESVDGSSVMVGAENHDIWTPDSPHWEGVTGRSDLYDRVRTSLNNVVQAWKQRHGQNAQIVDSNEFNERIEEQAEEATREVRRRRAGRGPPVADPDTGELQREDGTPIEEGATQPEEIEQDDLNQHDREMIRAIQRGVEQDPEVDDSSDDSDDGDGEEPDDHQLQLQT